MKEEEDAATPETVTPETPKTKLLRAFRDWVYALDWNDLQCAATIQLASASASSSSSSVAPVTHHHTSPKAIHRPTTETTTTTTTGEEWDLWQQMIAAQQPRVPPVHPQAISYPPASRRGKWDHCPDATVIAAHNNNSNSGRVGCGSCEDGTNGWPPPPKAEWHARFCPRLVRWIRQPPLLVESHPLYNNSNTSNSSSATTTSGVNHDKHTTTHRGGTNNSRSSCSSSRHNNNSNSNSSHCPSDYTVVARHFRHDDGVIYSVPPTRHQHQADWELLQGLVLEQQQCLAAAPYGSSPHTTTVETSSVDHGRRLRRQQQSHHRHTNTSTTRRNKDDVGSTAVAEAARTWTCTWQPPQQQHDNGAVSPTSSPRDGLLRLLQVASRGHFATVEMPPPTLLSSSSPSSTAVNNNKNKNTKAAATTKTTTVIVMAPWFDPTERWFTLAMYMASRMEVALWQTFHQQQRQQQQQQQQLRIPPPVPPPSPLIGGSRCTTATYHEQLLSSDPRSGQALLPTPKVQIATTKLNRTRPQSPPRAAKPCRLQPSPTATSTRNVPHRAMVLPTTRSRVESTKDDHCDSQLWVSAIVQTVRLVLQEENHRLASQNCFLRDGILWDLFVNQSAQWAVAKTIVPCDTCGLSVSSPTAGTTHQLFGTKLDDRFRFTCPLLESGSLQNEWRRKLYHQWHTILSDRKRDLLWRELIEDAEVVSDETSAANNVSPAVRGRGKKKPKKGKRKRIVVRHKDVSARPSRVSNTASLDNEDETSSSSADGIEAALIVARMRDEVPPADSKSTNESIKTRRAQSEHTVVVLALLEDVLVNVFEKVGLMSETTSKEYSQAMGFDECIQCEEEQPFHIVGKGGGTESFDKISKQQKKTLAKPVESSSMTVGCVESIDDINDATFTELVQPSALVPPDPEFHSHAILPSIDVDVRDTSFANQYPTFRNSPFLLHDPTITLRRSNLQGFNSHEYDTISQGLYLHSGSLGGTAWEMPGYTEPNNWNGLRGFDREESILTEFFHSQERDEAIVASSTAASIASSDNPLDDAMLVGHDTATDSSDEIPLLASIDDPSESGLLSDPVVELKDPVALVVTASFSDDDDDDELQQSECDYQSPSPPSTPSPTLSPILVSLSDLRTLPKDSLARFSFPSARSLSSEPTSGVQASRHERPTLPQMVASLSRENLRASFSADEPDCQRRPNVESSVMGKLAGIKPATGRPMKCRDDYDIFDKSAIRRSADALSSYRNVISRSGVCVDDHDVTPPVPDSVSRLSPKRATSSRDSLSPNLTSYKPIKSSSLPKGGKHFHFESMATEKHHQNLTTRSETALDGQTDFEWHEISRSKTEDADNHTLTRDGTTTISSAASHRETDEMIELREQRNTYRDMCLTLGAEVAKLKSLLASQRNLTMPPVSAIQPGYGYLPFPNTGQYDPGLALPPFLIAPRARTLAAMSDAGYRGEHESLASEDDAVHRMLSYETVQGFSSGVTVSVVQSDASLDHFSDHHLLQMPLGLQSSREKIDSTSINSMQSRLARDIFQFLKISNEHMRKLDSKIQTVVERINRLVTTVWPRAQVKLYGSHVTGLCVPTSDLDFVVCLPAVHKNAVADAPGALEGRNAINETSQKLLARRLKGESWIDPRSMKLIDRTAVPVIKVATKDTRKQTLHLDISFDSPGHHGVEAAQMTKSLMEEFPVLRPLVVVLKQFLIERSLLEAYTGGLSSYCLSLMVARYLQEQSSGSDVGSLLMGFLDFYGNHFDPRTTGISVRHRQYFARPIYFTTARNPGREPPVWTTQPPRVGSARRNSMSDKCRKDITSDGTMRFPPAPPFRAEYSQHLGRTVSTATTAVDPNSYDNRMPYTFDPLFVEDPLSLGNNVGRNAFRVVQVQRAFSDAHRALVAALEWDMHSTGDQQDVNDFPLLKCLLQSEDIVYDL